MFNSCAVLATFPGAQNLHDGVDPSLGKEAGARIHATCAVFVLPHLVCACPVGMRDDAHGVLWITVQLGQSPSCASPCAVMHAKVGGEASIANAVEQNTSRNSR